MIRIKEIYRNLNKSKIRCSFVDKMFLLNYTTFFCSHYLTLLLFNQRKTLPHGNVNALSLVF